MSSNRKNSKGLRPADKLVWLKYFKICHLCATFTFSLCPNWLFFCLLTGASNKASSSISSTSILSTSQSNRRTENMFSSSEKSDPSLHTTTTSSSRTASTPATASPSSSVASSVMATPTSRPGANAPAGLSDFGIVLVALGTFLVAFMVLALLWICCRGRERR